MTNDLDAMIDEMARDFTTVHPKTKSEVRRRILEAIEYAKTMTSQSKWADEEEMRGAIIRHTDFFLDVNATDEFVDVLLGDIKTLLRHAVSTREKEIAEAVEKMIPLRREGNCHITYSEGKIDLADDILSFIKH